MSTKPNSGIPASHILSRTLDLATILDALNPIEHSTLSLIETSTLSLKPSMARTGCGDILHNHIQSLQATTVILEPRLRYVLGIQIECNEEFWVARSSSLLGLSRALTWFHRLTKFRE